MINWSDLNQFWTGYIKPSYESWKFLSKGQGTSQGKVRIKYAGIGKKNRIF